MTIKKTFSISDQQVHAEFLALKAAINDGLNSGISQRGVKEIMKDREARMRADDRLQSALKD